MAPRSCAQPGPAFRNDDGVSGIHGVVANGSWQAELAGVDPDELAQVSDVLRSRVGDAADIIGINEELRAGAVGLDFLDVEHGAVTDATVLAEALPTRLFVFFVF